MTNENLPVEAKPFVLMDRLDDQQIIQELEGRLPDILTYHFKEGNQEVWGLSKAGVDECKTELAKQGEVIRELESHWEDGEDEAYFHARVGRYVINKAGEDILLDTAMGFKRQPKTFSSGKTNPFWYEQGAIKACRNACMRLIPKTIQGGIIEYAKKAGKVKKVDEKPPSTDDKKPSTIFANKEQLDSFKTKVFDYLESCKQKKEIPDIDNTLVIRAFHKFLIDIKRALKDGMTQAQIDHTLNNLDNDFIGFRKTKHWKELVKQEA
jgi:hypothetical protein